jgi:hypothetical protein
VAENVWLSLVSYCKFINSISRLAGDYSLSAFKGKAVKKNSGYVILKFWNRLSKSLSRKAWIGKILENARDGYC